MKRISEMENFEKKQMMIALINETKLQLEKLTVEMEKTITVQQDEYTLLGYVGASSTWENDLSKCLDQVKALQTIGKFIA